MSSEKRYRFKLITKLIIGIGGITAILMAAISLTILFHWRTLIINNLFNLMTPDLLQTLHSYDWPGNVRELENISERIIVMSETSSIEKIIDQLINTNLKSSQQQQTEYPPFNDFIIEKEKEIIQWALKKAGNNISLAAKILGLPRSTLRSKIEKFDFESYN